MSWADKFVGLPFVDGGRGPDGYDCWGLVMAAFAEFGVKLPDFKISCFSSDKIGQEVESQRKNWRRLHSPALGCLVLVKLDSRMPGVCNHCGVYIGEGKFLHTMERTGSVISRLTDPFWKQRTEGFYAWKPVK